MVLRIQIVLFISLCLLTKQLQAQYHYSNTVEQAHNEILNLNFENYNKLNNTFTTSESGLKLWLDSYKAFVEWNTTSENKKITSIISSINQNIANLNKLDKNEAMYNYCLVDMKFMLSLLYYENNEPIKAINSFLSAKKNINIYQNYFPNFKATGKHKLILLTVNSFLNQHMGWFSTEVEFNYSKFKTLVNQSINNSNELNNRELKLITLLLSNFYYGINMSDIVADLNLRPNYAQQGPLESYGVSVKYKKAGLFDQQNNVLAKASKLNYFNKLNVLNLEYGDYLLGQQNDSSILFLNRFLQAQEVEKFKNYARFKGSLHHFVNSNKVKSDSLNNIIAANTTDITYSDKQAQYEITNAHYWQKEIVQARILFDGGEYSKALKLLLASKNRITNYSTEQKLEYSYRMGRIYHKLNDLNKAQAFYKMVINSGFDKKFYYPAYAAYYLAELFELNGRIEDARYFYAFCIELSSPVYEFTIHNKAKKQLKNL